MSFKDLLSQSRKNSFLDTLSLSIAFLAEQKKALYTDLNILQRIDTVQLLMRKTNWREILSKRLQNSLLNSEKGIASIRGEAREAVRDRMADFIAAVAYEPNVFLKTFSNILLSGSAGSGKGKVASVYAYICAQLFFLLREEPLILRVGDFVGRGATQKLQKVLENSYERVVFLDEAYAVAGCTATGQHILQEESHAFTAALVDHLDKLKGKSLFIVAGYSDAMKCFLSVNEGMKRRFQTVDLAPYTKEDVFQLFQTTLQRFKNPYAKYAFKDVLSGEELVLIKKLLGKTDFTAGDVERVVTRLLTSNPLVLLQSGSAERAKLVYSSFED